MDGGEASLIVDGKGVDNDWTVTQRGVCYVDMEPTRKTTECFDVATHETTRLFSAEGASEIWGGLSLSPNGQWLLYTRLTPANSDLMLVEDFR